MLLIGADYCSEFEKILNSVYPKEIDIKIIVDHYPIIHNNGVCYRAIIQYNNRTIEEMYFKLYYVLKLVTINKRKIDEK